MLSFFSETYFIGIGLDVEHSLLSAVNWHSILEFVDAATVVDSDDDFLAILSHALEKLDVTVVEEIEAANSVDLIGDVVVV